MDNKNYTSEKDKKIYYDEYDYEISKKQHVITIVYRVLVIILIIIAILLAWFRHCKCDCDFNIPGFNDIPWADDISWDDDSKRADQQALNDKVAEGMLTVSINADPEFHDKNSKGTFNFENYGGNNDHAGNTKPIMIEVYLKSDIEKNDRSNPLYKSGKIPVGAKIKTAALNGDISALGKGDWKCVAFFLSLNEKNEVVGQAGAECTLHILN